VHRLIGKVNRYEETAHPLKGSPLAAAVNPCRPIAGQFSPPSFLVTRPASESTLIETVRLSNVGLNPAKELEGIDVGRLRSNQEPAANGIGESLAQDILGLRFGGP